MRHECLFTSRWVRWRLVRLKRNDLAEFVVEVAMQDDSMLHVSTMLIF